MSAIVFDCDGVLADTERDGHLPAFNATFEHFGLPLRWSQERYGELLAIGGGKERLATVFDDVDDLPTDPDERRELVAQWHREKTARYTRMVADGVLPARPGIARIVEEAHAAGWTLAVASTSAEASVRAVLEHAVGPTRARDVAVFAGDVVPAKKPAPDIYLLALHELGLDPDDVVVVEDSSNGLRAALAAGGLTTVVTVSSYTADEDFTGAALVVDSLGDPPAVPTSVLVDPHGVGPLDHVDLTTLTRLLTARKEHL
ncbi:HAD-IA family hydrolase [Cellulomonas composti]|uniref:Phosphatase n=1 Tax=Cellulomonas composti TaxID=266130 RepID=A0A511JD61_9CELL|nr:HAD-IA family hydrolase [Cellulomonas composti]GEL95915.1 phosphatase [Cellulomonas composti]